jgi:hypothetical protein
MKTQGQALLKVKNKDLIAYSGFDLKLTALIYSALQQLSTGRYSDQVMTTCILENALIVMLYSENLCEGLIQKLSVIVLNTSLCKLDLSDHQMSLYFKLIEKIADSGFDKAVPQALIAASNFIQNKTHLVPKLTA